MTYGQAYVKTYEVVQVEWDSPWEDPSSNGTGGSILNAACRPATFLNYINTSGLHAAATPMCGQGFSAGSAAYAYALAWYGAENYLSTVELLSGPVTSQIDQGCIYPRQPDQTICGTTGGAKQYGCTAATTAWTDNQIYVDGYVSYIDKWTGTPLGNSCATSNASGYLSTWKQMGIVDGTSGTTSPTFNYPNTSVHGWLCAGYQQCTAPHCPNNSAAQGNFFYEQLNATSDPIFKLTGVLACKQEEGVTEGTDPDSNGPASTAIISDMKLHCAVQ